MTAHTQQRRVLDSDSLISQADRRILDRLYGLAVDLQLGTNLDMRLVLAPHIAPGLTSHRGYPIQRAMGGNAVAVVPR